MEPVPDRMAIAVPASLEREMQLIREAIFMVASGQSARVVVSGLRFGQALLNSARATAVERGVRVVPLWTIEDAMTSIAVEAAPRA